MLGLFAPISGVTRFKMRRGGILGTASRRRENRTNQSYGNQNENGGEKKEDNQLGSLRQLGTHIATEGPDTKHLLSITCCRAMEKLTPKAGTSRQDLTHSKEGARVSLIAGIPWFLSPSKRRGPGNHRGLLTSLDRDIAICLALTQPD